MVAIYLCRSKESSTKVTSKPGSGKFYHLRSSTRENMIECSESRKRKSSPTGVPPTQVKRARATSSNICVSMCFICVHINGGYDQEFGFQFFVLIPTTIGFLKAKIGDNKEFLSKERASCINLSPNA